MGKFMSKWYSIDRLRRAWKYTKLDARDNFIFDVINHGDLKHNIEKVLRVLNSQIENEQYRPAPIISVATPKNEYSTRPGTTIALIDTIVLYAIMQELAPILDNTLSDSAYAYRLNPKRGGRGEHLFKEKEHQLEEDKRDQGDPEVEIEELEIAEDIEIEFPSSWFVNWIEFHEETQEASKKEEYVAVTDITGFFENISIDILFEQLHSLLDENNNELLKQLRIMLEYWDWSLSTSKTPKVGLPQGHDVSSFLANIYLRDLDKAMENVVGGDAKKYFRYVDDIQIYTSDRGEACRALVELEKVVRRLGLNVQSAKTEVKPAHKVFDRDVVEWEKLLAEDNEEALENARRFINEIFDHEDPDSLAKWDRIYRRSLTILGRSDDDLAVPTAFQIFLTNPSHKLVVKNFVYLKRFILEHFYERDIYERLRDNSVHTFDYHRAFLYRLGAHSRGYLPELKQFSLDHATTISPDWFSRVAALMFLSTHDLSGEELARVGKLINSENDPQVLRAAFITLIQHSGKELETLLDAITFFNAPYQDYLQRYFFQVIRNQTIGEKKCSHLRQIRLKNPDFISQLHLFDLIKANHHCRSIFNEIIEEKINECSDEWPRLKTRLEGIRKAFVEKP
jgi:retron-type reverse transcriptase